MSPPLAASSARLHDAVKLLRGRTIVALTGAGISTESGIPDYRGPATRARARNPIQHAEFVRDPAARRRYWARSVIGWPRIAVAEPNPAHAALVALEDSGPLAGVITQNVDRLHARAGSRRVVELHGALAEVACLACGRREARAALQERLLALNLDLAALAAGEEAVPGEAGRSAAPAAGEEAIPGEAGRSATPAAGEEAVPGEAGRSAESGGFGGQGRGPRAVGRIAPDGDADLPAALIDRFRVADCETCGGVLKPDVVFFGGCVPAEVVAAAHALVDAAEALLVVGSSLAVYSGYRFVRRAAERGAPIAIVNLGPTRGDPLAALCWDERACTALPLLAAMLAA